MDRMEASGPLKGVRVVEFAGIGPAPFCGMLLSDLGAEVVRIDRPGARPVAPFDVTHRGRRTVQLDLKSAEAKAACLALIGKSHILIEGFRPGVMERLGLGPDEALAANPKLVFGRMTGWGQTGPFAQAAGHDMTYIALSGALHAVGIEREADPAPEPCGRLRRRRPLPRLRGAWRLSPTRGLDRRGAGGGRGHDRRVGGL